MTTVVVSVDVNSMFAAQTASFLEMTVSQVSIKLVHILQILWEMLIAFLSVVRHYIMEAVTASLS